jgi:hypothetical protein
MSIQWPPTWGWDLGAHLYSLVSPGRLIQLPVTSYDVGCLIVLGSLNLAREISVRNVIG